MTGAEQILALFPKAVAVLSAEQRILFANRAFADLCGVPELNERRLTEAVAAMPALASALGNALWKIHGSDWTAEFSWSVGDGEDAEVFQVRVKAIGPDSFIAVFDDVSEQVSSGEIQQGARVYLEAVLNRLPLGVIVLDSEFKTTLLNKEQSSLLARLGSDKSLFEIIGSPVADVYPLLSREEWTQIQAKVVRLDESATIERVAYPREAPKWHFSMSVLPLARPFGTDGAICVTEDVSRLIELERELVDKERLALVGHVAITLNHEINNPLTAILGMSEALLARSELDADAKRRVGVIKSGALRISEVTRSLRRTEHVTLTEYMEGGPVMLDLSRSSA